jgi:dTDP-4-amino-4,6-dideoxygalactose transaminase
MKRRSSFLPFALPDIGSKEHQQVNEVLESGWLTTGPKTRQLETEFADYFGVKHAIAVNSCTAGLHLALDSIGLSAGDFVLTSPYTFAATAEVVRYFQAIPVFVDVQPDTINLDPGKLAETIQDLKQTILNGTSPQTTAVQRALSNNPIRRGVIRAIIPVHYGGHPCEVDAIYSIACESGLAYIDDAAHSLPARYKEKLIGSPMKGTSPILSCFSFYATKSMTTGEGGMITTEDDRLADRCRMMCLHGISKDAWKRYTAEGSWYYEILAAGYKYNLTDLAAALGIAQLSRLEEMWKRRQQIAAAYNKVFASYKQLDLPVVRKNCESAWHLYPIRFNLNYFENPSTTVPFRNTFIEEMKHRNIGTSVHFIPLHLHPYYRETYGYEADDFPVALNQYKRLVSLPIYSRMSDDDVESVIDAVVDIIEGYRRH